jgi:hypothetical protein
VRYLCGRIALMRDGLIVETGVGASMLSVALLSSSGALWDGLESGCQAQDGAQQTSVGLTAEHPVLACDQGWSGPGQ